MKISIITVCYNSSKTIEKTINSLLGQTYKEIEYIIIDGKSSDNTLEIIQRYITGIDIFISESDDGLYDAMNKGIALANGDLIGILNSDDVFKTETVLEEVANFHKKNKIDASVGNIVQYNQKGKVVRKYSAKKWNPEKLKIGFMPPHPAIFFKRELFKKLGFYSLDFKIGADYELIVRFFLKHNISWKYNNLNTTAMLIGGLSSSGYHSYKTVTKEICMALESNNIKFSRVKIALRGFWKIIGWLNKT